MIELVGLIVLGGRIAQDLDDDRRVREGAAIGIGGMELGLAPQEHGVGVGGSIARERPDERGGPERRGAGGPALIEQPADPGAEARVLDGASDPRLDAAAPIFEAFG